MRRDRRYEIRVLVLAGSAAAAVAMVASPVAGITRPATTQSQLATTVPCGLESALIVIGYLRPDVDLKRVCSAARADRTLGDDMTATHVADLLTSAGLSAAGVEVSQLDELQRLLRDGGACVLHVPSEGRPGHFAPIVYNRGSFRGASLRHGVVAISRDHMATLFDRDGAVRLVYARNGPIQLPEMMRKHQTSWRYPAYICASAAAVLLLLTAYWRSRARRHTR